MKSRRFAPLGAMIGLFCACGPLKLGDYADGDRGDSNGAAPEGTGATSGGSKAAGGASGGRKPTPPPRLGEGGVNEESDPFGSSSAGESGAAGLPGENLGGDGTIWAPEM